MEKIVTEDKEPRVVPGRTDKGKEKRVNFLIAQEVWERLSDVAKSRGQTASELMRDAIALELWMLEEIKKGNTFLLSNQKETKRIVLP